ncbi:MAG: TRAP transporter substrate-binding protein [Bacteroidales bacterium]|nr:TRAP transporter substrate-binding protein [Bacteroidales bacterium]
MIKRLLILLLLPVIFLACGTDTKKTLILAHGLDTKHSVHKAMVYMADQLKELSDGKLEIRIYPSQQLGTERQCLELLQIGSVDITKVSAAVMEGFAPVYKVLSIPYIFQSREHEYAVLDGPVGEKILKAGGEFWLRGLCFYDSGSRSFYTKDHPILKPEDLNGLKIRVMSSPTSIEMVKLMGGAATPISWGELYTALQGGVVDGAENNPPSFYLSHHYEVCKYYSLNEHSSIPDVVLISTITWKKLSNKEQVWLTEAVKKSVTYQRELWLQSEKESLKAVEEAGVEISYPDKKPFMEKVKPLKEKYKKDPKLRSIIEAIDNQAETILKSET